MNALAPRLLRSASLIAAGCLLGLAAQAAAPAKGCTDHAAQHDPAACRHETGAAKEEAKRGGLTTPAAGAADANAADRCRALSGGQRTDCLTRQGSAAGGASVTTTTSGSVETGGVIRETTTVLPAAKP